MNNSQITYKNIDQLAFDPDNPRLPETLRSKKDKPDYEQSVIEWMLQYENVTELMGSIGEKGFFPAEPLLIVPGANGLYEVVEGNRRLTAVKLLNNPNLAKKRRRAIDEIIREAQTEKIPTEIPCIEFGERNDVIAYLGYKHITGVEAWDSLAKAKYLNQLLATLPEGNFYDQCKTLAKIIGSKASYVRLLLVGVETYYRIEDANFYDVLGLGEENFEFGVFYTALQRSNIAKYVGIDFDSQEPLKDVNEDRLKELVVWLFEKSPENTTRIGESRNLSKLNKILDEKFPKALSAFRDEKKTLEEAVRLTDHPLEIFQNSLNDSLSSLETARNYIHQIDNPSETQADSLKQIFKLARDLHQLVNSKIMDLDSGMD